MIIVGFQNIHLSLEIFYLFIFHLLHPTHKKRFKQEVARN